MDKRVLRERMRKKQQQIRRRQMMKKGAYVVAIILVLIFVIRGIILPVINRAGGGNTEKPQQVQAETDSTTTDSSSDSTDTGDTSTETNAAIRQPVKGQSDLTKAAQLTTGWHDLVRFFALLRIKPHAPPLVRVPVNSFEFHSCERTPQVEYLMRLRRHRKAVLSDT